MKRGALLGFLLLMFALIAVPAAHAEIYEWVDVGGNKHFTDDPQKVPPEYRDQVEDVTEEVRERDREQLEAQRAAEREKRKAEAPPPPEDPTDAAIQESLLRVFAERDLDPPTREEIDGFISLVRVWLFPLALSFLLILGLGAGLTIHALINNNWPWVVGSLVWVVGVFFVQPADPMAVFEAPVLWSIVSYLWALPVIAYPPFKVGLEDREYLRWLLPALTGVAMVIAVAGTAKGLDWSHQVIAGRDIAIPGAAQPAP